MSLGLTKAVTMDPSCVSSLAALKYMVIESLEREGFG